MKPSGILCGPLPLFAALKSFLGLRVALGCSLKLSRLSGAVCGCLLVYGALWRSVGLSGALWGYPELVGHFGGKLAGWLGW